MKSPNHIYHLFPLGALYDKANHSYRSIRTFESWIDHWKRLHIDTVLLGPVFESVSHGYDTVNWRRVDPRIGSWEDLQSLIQRLHENDIRVVLDAVWNHTSRKHFAYRDLQEKGMHSKYADWYRQIDWNKPNKCGDSFTVEGWNGFQELPQLNLNSSSVQQEIMDVASLWIDSLNIDGVRLDAADVMDRNFLKKLSSFCRSRKENFWLMGEVVFGNPRLWLDEAELDSVTGYEVYKSLWSSFNDNNFFEIAYSLKRLFANNTGLCREKHLTLFNENHDVSRVRSILKDPSDWYPLHFLFYTLPGIPSIYYGEEFGFQAIKGNQEDSNLRPSIKGIPPETIPEPHYLGVLEHLSGLRLSKKALLEGGYTELEVTSRRLAFKRTHGSGDLMVFINGEKNPTAFLINENNPNIIWIDITDPQAAPYRAENGKIKVLVDANWGKVLTPQLIS